MSTVVLQTSLIPGLLVGHLLGLAHPEIGAWMETVEGDEGDLDRVEGFWFRVSGLGVRV